MKGDQQNILTLEDPVEFVIDGLTQIQLDRKDPMRPATFEEGLRSILRHDPDTIFMGEIRAEPAARAAIDASFGGHVLLSTMHARDPAGAVTLLRSMGAEDYEIAASLRIVVGQRLIRLLCGECKAKHSLTDPQAAAVEAYGVELKHHWEAEGCEACSGTGYRGLSAAFEVWRLDEQDYDAILAHEDEKKLRSSLRKRGVRSLLASAFERVRSGETALPEAFALRF
jgi:type II secretory ATPase GspE/PulE/Tfp pilus assembly ATPase PilB-like protein